MTQEQYDQVMEDYRAKVDAAAREAEEKLKAATEQEKPKD